MALSRTQMVGMCLTRTGRTWSFIYRTLRGVLVCPFNCVTKDAAFYTTTSRFVCWIGAFSQARQELWLPKDDLRDSSSWSSPQTELPGWYLSAPGDCPPLRISLNSTVSLRLPLRGMRALPPMLVLLSFLHSLRSPSRSCFIVSPSGILRLDTWDHVVLNS
jgi:hypothetical protein